MKKYRALVSFATKGLKMHKGEIRELEGTPEVLELVLIGYLEEVVAKRRRKK